MLNLCISTERNYTNNPRTTQRIRRITKFPVSSIKFKPKLLLKKNYIQTRKHLGEQTIRIQNGKMTSPLSNSTKLGFALTGILVSAAGLLFNIFGIYALVRTKLQGNKQAYLLINISTVSLCMSLLFLADWVVNGLISFENKKTIVEYLLIAESASCIVLATGAIVLSIDRLLAVALPFRHRTIVTTKFILVSISFCWFIGLLPRIPFLLMSYPDKLLHMVYFDVSVNAVNIFFQPITYLFILFKWHRRSKTFNNSNSQIGSRTGTKTESIRTRDSKREIRMLKIALMVAGSCIFSGICDIFYVAIGMTTPSSNQSPLSQTAFLMWTIVPMIQSLLYILLKPEIRKFFMKILPLSTNVE